jgi:predicted RNA binding protein YcfA (HicA-like mRNA interferase family)
MPRLPVLKPKEVLRARLRAGFEIHHQSGSHAQLRNPQKPHLRVPSVADFEKYPSAGRNDR